MKQEYSSIAEVAEDLLQSESKDFEKTAEKANCIFFDTLMTNVTEAVNDIETIQLLRRVERKLSEAIVSEPEKKAYHIGVLRGMLSVFGSLANEQVEMGWFEEKMTNMLLKTPEAFPVLKTMIQQPYVQESDLKNFDDFEQILESLSAIRCIQAIEIDTKPVYTFTAYGKKYVDRFLTIEKRNL